MSARVMAAASALLLTLLTTVPAGAALVYDDTIPGNDFSNDRSNPTDVSFAPGDNDIIGVTGGIGVNGGPPADLDYFTFVIPQGLVLKSLTVLDSRVGGGALQFIGIELGDVITVDPAAPVAGPLLGWKHIRPESATPTDVGTDILPAIGQGAGAQHFTPPLGPGTYTVWVQDSSTPPSNYELRFTVVPVPGTALLTAVGLASLSGPGILRSLARRARARGRFARA